MEAGESLSCENNNSSLFSALPESSNIPAKPSKPNCIPTLKCPASSSHSPAKSHQANNHHKPTSRNPTSKCKLISRPSAYLNKPTSQKKYNTSLRRPSNSVHSNATIARPSTTVHNNPVISRPSYSPDEVLNILAQLIAIKGYSEVKNTPNAETSPESAQTHQHLLCQVNQANQVNLQVNCRNPPALAPMTQRQIQIPQQVMTHNP